MKFESNWSRFLKSGKVTDYLYFVNSSEKDENRGEPRKPFYCGSACNKGNENRGE